MLQNRLHQGTHEQAFRKSRICHSFVVLSHLVRALTVSHTPLDVFQRGYEGNWLGGTFSKAVFVGNGLVAIVAGLLGHALVEVLQLGPVSPFDAAALVLLIGGAYIAFSWTENYGESSDKAPFHVSLVNAGKTVWEGARVVLSPLRFIGILHFLTVHPF